MRGGLIGSSIGDLAVADRSAWLLGSCRLMVGLLLGGRPWELLRDDAAEGQERPLSVRLGQGLPEVSQ
jgi:hypothetical protein